MIARPPAGPPDLGLAVKCAFLSRPDSYPESTLRVVPVETHMSWVFLLDGNAYKLKKPMQLPYLDFSTAALRLQYCAEEVRLNRRLTDNVYLGVVPLIMTAAGALHVGDSDGRVVDALVHMRRLPAERMLDRMIEARTLREDDLRRVVARLADFYRAAAAIPTTPAAYRARLAAAIGDNRRELLRPAYGLRAADVVDVCDLQDAALERHAAQFAERATAGRVVEAHGDLRPEHICAEAHPQIIDCLEFSRELRILDPADELAFLALECARLGAPWAHACIFATYAERTGDTPPVPLVSFYRSLRACVRAKIAVWHLNDDGVRAREKWITRAGDYLRLARADAAACA